jgi:hypothetical protein
VLSNAKSPVYGNTGGNSPTVEPAVFGNKAFRPTCNGYSVTLLGLPLRSGVLPNVTTCQGPSWRS